MRKQLSLLLMPGLIILLSKNCEAQDVEGLKSIQVDHLTVSNIKGNNNQAFHLDKTVPLVDFELNGKYCTSFHEDQWQQKLAVNFEADQNFSPGFKGTVSFKNISNDTIQPTSVFLFFHKAQINHV
jgi:hypothetical protein